MSFISCEDVLREIAKQMKSKLSKCKHYDPNVCTFGPGPSDITKIITTTGQPFCSKTAFRLKGQNLRLYANDEFVEIQILFESGIEPISINNPDEVSFLSLAGVVPVEDRKYPIFTRKATLTRQHTLLTKDARFKDFIRAVQPQQEESVHFSLGDLRIYLRRPSTERVLIVTEQAAAFVGGLARRDQEIDFSDLPSQFSALFPLIPAWGITDDAQREERRQDVPRAALQAVVDEVRPYFSAINAYLNSFGNQPLPNSAVALGALAEFAAETDLYLKDARTGASES